MLETVDRIESSARRRPAGGRAGEMAGALRALAFAASDDAAWSAYHRVLFAIGNDHAGTYCPIALDAVPFLGEILEHGSARSRARTLDVLIDLVGTFSPEPDALAVDEMSAEELTAALRARASALVPVLGTLIAEGPVSEVARLAGELVGLLVEDGAGG